MTRTILSCLFTLGIFGLPAAVGLLASAGLVPTAAAGGLAFGGLVASASACLLLHARPEVERGPAFTVDADG